MSFGMYGATRVLRTPLIWYGRRRNANASEEERWRLEHHAYRRVARKVMDLNGIDPNYFYRADLDASAIVVDVGAHNGTVAQKLVDLYGCQVYAYEPNPGLYSQLEQRFAESPLVHPRPYGLGASDATMVMEQRGLGSTVYSSGNGAFPTVPVAIRDGAAVFDELGHERIDYLKLNIEGAEYDLLDRLIEAGWVRRTRYLLIQFHEWIEGAHKRRWQIRRKLRATHDQVWNHPWIYELWCAKDRPHPPPPSWTAAEMEEIRSALRAR
jgi:FkbM family methyltransferase